MPFTPFHIGHAVITYSIFDKLDFIALIYGSILVDIEPFLILFLNLPYPLHGPIHSIIGVLAITPLIYIITLITKLILSKMGFSLRKNSRRIIIASILIGGYTHITLDAFLYSEMNLTWPLALSLLESAVWNFWLLRSLQLLHFQFSSWTINLHC